MNTSVRAESYQTDKDLAKACDVVLAKCADTVKAKNKQIELSDLALKQSLTQSQNLAVELSETKSKLESPFRNPFFMGAIGLVIGIVVTGLATK